MPHYEAVADKNGRLACKELFTPRKPFSAERQADGSIRVVELVEAGGILFTEKSQSCPVERPSHSAYSRP